MLPAAFSLVAMYFLASRALFYFTLLVRDKLEQVEQLLLERALGPVTQAAADLDAARTNFLVLGLAGVLDTEAAMLLFATLLDGSVAER